MEDLQSFKKLWEDNQLHKNNGFLMVSPQFIAIATMCQKCFLQCSFLFSLLTICTKSGKNTFKVLPLNCLKRNPRKCAVLNGLLMVLPPIYCIAPMWLLFFFCIGYFWVSLLRIWAKKWCKSIQQWK